MLSLFITRLHLQPNFHGTCCPGVCPLCLRILLSIPFPCLPCHSHRSAQQEEIWENYPHFQLDSDIAMAKGLLRLCWSYSGSVGKGLD